MVAGWVRSVGRRKGRCDGDGDGDVNGAALRSGVDIVQLREKGLDARDELTAGVGLARCGT